MSATLINQSERDHLVKLLIKSRDNVITSTDQLSTEQWTFRQNKESWSIGDNVEHLGLVEPILFGQVTSALVSDVNPNWEEATAGKESLLKEKLLDRSTRRDAPNAVLPVGGVQPAYALRVFKEHRDVSLQFTLETVKPLKAHTADHRRPVYGTLNAYQWLLFIAYHTLRHVEQIEDVTRAPGFPGG
ncbi:MAG: DinB family protein [Vicinamibacterales bacterium]